MTDSPLSPTMKVDRWMQATLIMLAAFAIARIVMLAVSPVALHADESQYWVWSRSFDWGYFSKPPMIAWLIGLSTMLLGDSDFAVRLPAPLLHTGTALFLCLCARRLFDARTGFFAALTWLTLPAIWLSGFVMSTDAILLCCWSGGLYALLRLRAEGRWSSAVALGFAIGLGFLSKYAMIYFAIGLGIALILDRPTRSALLGPRGGLALAIAALCLAPNIAWNAAHDFATVSHMAANANWGGDLFHLDEMLGFLGDQLAVFGPALFITMIAIAGRNLAAFRQMGEHTRLLLGFILPPLLAVTVQAFLSRAHANWAVSAYAAGTILVVGFLMAGPVWRRYVLGLSIAGHSALGLLMVALAASPALVVALHGENATKRIRAWDDTAAAIAEAAAEGDYTYIVFDDRNVFHQTQRYAPQLHGQLRMWLRHAGPLNHAEDVWPLPESFEGEILIVSHRPMEVPRLREDFAVFEPAGTLAIPLDGAMTRDFTLWRASGPQRVIRDSGYEARWQAHDATVDYQRGYSTGEEG